METNHQLHLKPCCCERDYCQRCARNDACPNELGDMLGIYRNVRALKIHWKVNGNGSPELPPRHFGQSFTRLTALDVRVEYDLHGMANNLFDWAGSIIDHLHLPVLEDLVVRVHGMDTLYRLNGGLGTIAASVCGVASSSLDRFRLEIGGVLVFRLPQTSLWVSLWDSLSGICS